ncbi:MAG: LemA family protein [Paracholeplasma sp.]|nr:LemA family protein [Paracholeplasma sp.]MDY3195315.1 LemA family protein [Paracholeplasma sp.]
MKTTKYVLIASVSLILIVSLILGILSVRYYNRLVSLDENINESYAQVYNRLEQRHDTITQMVSTVSGLQEHEQAIYELIVEARTKYLAASASNDVDALAEADALESQAITQLLVVIEDNPNLTVSSAFNGLLDTIYALESALSVARRDYNNDVASYNRTVRRFPGNIYKNIYSFESNLSYWRINEGVDEVPNIDFGD